jgi:hypothetical protein
MIPDLLNYKVSILNPALKLIVPLIFFYGTYWFYRSRQEYGGEIGKVVQRLAVAGVVGVLANGFRYTADVVDVSWKWGESLGFLVFGLVNAYAVWPLVTFIRRIPKAQP